MDDPKNREQYFRRQRGGGIDYWQEWRLERGPLLGARVPSPEASAEARHDAHTVDEVTVKPRRFARPARGPHYPIGEVADSPLPGKLARFGWFCVPAAVVVVTNGVLSLLILLCVPEQTINLVVANLPETWGDYVPFAIPGAQLLVFLVAPLIASVRNLRPSMRVIARCLAWGSFAILVWPMLGAGITLVLWLMLGMPDKMPSMPC